MKQKNKLSIVIAIIIVSNLISIGVTYNLSNYLTKTPKLDYSNFATLSNEYIDNLNKQYPNSFIANPTLTVYPGHAELNKYWTESVYNAINNDLAFLKQKSIYILNNEKNIVTKVVFNYDPNLHHKAYFSVNRIFTNPIDAKKLELDVNPTFSNSISTNGIFIQVTTIGLVELMPDRQFEEKMIKMNTEITSKIQEYIIKTYEK
ncbi:hypothetical protein [Brassicibacter mesophilus]|uniref:hypothetical protein n=1 Tax=Brassicibacter mesophilus TaxID=745119 RepID=UPI003D1F9D49